MSGKGKGKAPAKGRGRGLQRQVQDPAQETSATTSASTTATTMTTAGEQTGEKRKRSEEASVSETSDGRITPLADLLTAQSGTFVKMSPTSRARKVGELCSDFPSLIPPDAPAPPEDMAVLEKKGFHFVANVKPLGEGTFGTIYECTCTVKKADGTEVSKILACKRVAINYPVARLDQTIRDAENQMIWEMQICELLIDNPHKNVAKHELLWKITSTKTDIPYQNPIIHLIFMEQCQGNLKDFVIQNFGYSTDQNYSGAPTEFVNKVWMRHVCQGLDFLHNADKGHEMLEWIPIIHHDLKHANILYKMRNGRVKFLICDFGLSEYQFLDSELDRKQHQVMTTSRNGNERFWPDEVFKLKDEYAKWQQNPVGTFQGTAYEARKKDVYAVGLMLHDCLIGFAQLQNTYSVANQWRRTLHHQKFDDCRNSPLFAHVNAQCFDLTFSMLTYDVNQRPLIQDVLTDPWLNDSRLASSYIDIQSELPAAKRLATGKPQP